MKTIGISEELHKELIALKLEEKNKNVAELIKKLVEEHRQKRFLEFSNLFRERLKKKGIGFEKLLKRSRKIREEIADEWFSN